MIINTFEEVTHPDGKIILLDGTMLDAYSRESEKRDNADEEFFLQNAVFLYENRDKIMRDSRMFLALVPIKCGLAYTNTSRLERPTLGVYVEWWLTCGKSVILDKKGRMHLIYHIAGSPLSGGNHCSAVNEEGRTNIVSVYPFRDVWTSFMRINNRYNVPKQRYDYYTLAETINILKTI